MPSVLVGTGAPVGSQEDRIALAVAQQAGQGADAARTADTIGAFRAQIEAALAPIVGQRGVDALFERSVHLAAAHHPWLRLQDEAQATDFPALKSAIAQQDDAEAAAGGIAVLQAFHALLTSLIGSSLTLRLLDAVWTPPPPSSGSPAQDTPP